MAEESRLIGLAAKAVSFAAAFRHPAFAVIWTATLVSNVGSWMYGAASGWLMTSLNPDPLIVSLVQAASNAADFSVRDSGRRARRYFRQAQIPDRRRNSDDGGVGGLCGDRLARFGHSRQSAVVHFSDRRRRSADRPGAGRRSCRNSFRRTICRGGRRQQRRRQHIARARSGARRRRHCRAAASSAPFWINAISNLGVVGALLWWREAEGTGTLLPAERFGRGHRRRTSLCPT